MNIYLVILFSLLLVFTSCNNPKDNRTVENKNDSNNKSTRQQIVATVKRIGMVTGIKADKIEQYKKLHANIWPAVLSKIKDCNIQNYSIYLNRIDGKYFLFSYFEYTGADFDMDMKRMAADSTTQRWWKETAPAQIPLPEAAAKNETWIAMEEVFHSN